MPEQYQQLAAGRLDVGVGRAELAPPGIASLLIRQDPLGVLVPCGHRFAELDSVPVAVLAEEPPLLAEEAGPGIKNRSDETLVDVAPSPPRFQLQAGGQRVVGLLVVRPGMAAR